VDSVRLVGRETGLAEQGEAAALRLEMGFSAIRAAVAQAQSGLITGDTGRWAGVGPGKRVAFLEWLQPLFNGGHWIPDIMHEAGAVYTMSNAGDPLVSTTYCQKSIQISEEELVQYDPDVVLVAPCGFDRARAHADAQTMWRHHWWVQLRAVKEGQVYALDGNTYYARPGPRLLQGCGIIARLLHGDNVGDNIGEEIAPRNSWTVVHPP
ncbi:unnamed protein product, partial [Choristocarpus tenellus]